VTGTISAGNSLIGTATTDNVGSHLATALTNGNYVVISATWGGRRGAATWGNGAGGTTGAVTFGNSTTGGSPEDRVGIAGVTPLAAGNYTVNGYYWNAGRGAITWGDGEGDTDVTVSAANSLVGDAPGDGVGSFSGSYPMPQGNYAVCSPQWDNGALTNAGAVTFAARDGGTVGSINANNSVVGAMVDGGTNNFGACIYSFQYDSANEQLVVGKPKENKVTLFRPTHTAITSGNSSNAATWDYGAFTRTGDVVIPGGRVVTLDSDILAVNSVTVAAGAVLAMSGNRRIAGNVTVYGTLDLSGGRLDTTGGSLTIASGGILVGASSSNYVVGRFEQNITSGGTYTFHVGTANGYSPVTLSNVVGTGTFAVEPHQGSYPGAVSGLPGARASRWWQLTNGGLTSADVQFTYAPGDISSGTESNYRAYRINNGGATLISGGNNTATRTVTALNVTQFSPWTLADQLTPTSAEVTIGGRATTFYGRGIDKARVTLISESGQTRMALTNPSGYYRFTGVVAGHTYILSISDKRYQFDSPTQAVFVPGEMTNLDFAASP
jgi:hypothetical protein